MIVQVSTTTVEHIYAERDAPEILLLQRLELLLQLAVFSP